MKNFNKIITPVTTSGIYHNVSQGLISLSSDGTNWITIADKNLGATQVYNNGDTLSEANCGKFYQWGNNYGFPFTGAISTASGTVNTSSYGPGNYYSNSTFRITSGANDRSNPSNNNLRGGETGTNEAMQGPCDSGYHIPTITEFTNLINAGITIGAWASTSWNGFKDYLKFGASSRLQQTDGTRYVYDKIRLWTCNKGTTQPTRSCGIAADATELSTSGQFGRGLAYPIRPFANTPVQPDNRWAVLYQ